MAKANNGRKTKVIGIHSALTDTAAEVANLAHRLDQVEKISPGEIRHVKGGRRVLKFHPIRGGVWAKVQGGGAIQDLFIYTHFPAEVQKLITEEFRV